MSRQAHPGHCAWHDDWADDVVLVTVHEGGSGPGGGAHACLRCARELTQRSATSTWLRDQITAMEIRATALANTRQGRASPMPDPPTCEYCGTTTEALGNGLFCCPSCRTATTRT
ncbi:hypothetical protein H181DRAFT_01800 [Streptomyces sp. WMMB 714]|uniref:hypothetical protein n=1 Tax=Streptomyces sp. WMMB 714 TaxID=1286822 RepID=UPI0005F790A6|nr:hypothetical protein [Streptomyces sp. WMMB 714]SCK23882.1 hypothetical protein H181DRAFT_01800 [Streptomyces sp. WMMB 714]